MEIKIDINSQIPVYKQIVNSVQELVSSNHIKKGDFLPSMNVLADELQISKETVRNSYSILREKGIIESALGKGFYVVNKENEKYKILLLFDKLSNYKQVLYSSFQSTLGDVAEITIRLHNQEFELFQEFIEENLNNFDYYIIIPHFQFNQDVNKKVLKVLKKIPNRKLILLDRYIKELSGNFGAVYQDFENDVYNGLTQGVNDLKKFKKLNVISMPGSKYAFLIEKGIKKFCTINKIPFTINNNIHIENINEKEVYLILNSQLDIELIELAKTAITKGYIIGEDIGIISYNESPINEIVMNGLTVLSTDFKQMGELTAKMILEKSLKKVKCDFRLIRRKTF